jgi:hypothetical protein
MPLFLEGMVHALRCEEDPSRVRALHQKVRKSPLFDKALKMYKINADISAETEEIGRTKVFPRGWLENESIWIHMEYKYLLELLRHGLYDEFYEDFATCCVAFLDPSRYGRSILENSSFIVSSAHQDQAMHGQGFVARLSGSTAEFVHMWMFMNAGARPFVVNPRGELELIFRPALKGCCFTSEKAVAEFFTLAGEAVRLDLPANTYAFHFMGRTLVVYHNARRKDTFGSDKVEVKHIVLQYPGKKTKEIAGGIIPAPLAQDVRDGKVVRIDMVLE